VPKSTSSESRFEGLEHRCDMVKSTSQWMRCRSLSYIDSRDSTQGESMQGRANTQGRVRYVFLKWTSIMWDLENSWYREFYSVPDTCRRIDKPNGWCLYRWIWRYRATTMCVRVRDYREFHIWRPKRSWSWSWINAEAPKTDLNGVGGWSGCTDGLWDQLGITQSHGCQDVTIGMLRTSSE